jgi:surface protein
MSDTLSLTFYNSAGGSWNVTLPITGTSVTVSINWGNGTTNTSLSNTYSGTGPFIATITITSGNVTRLGGGSGWTGNVYLTTVTTTNASTWGLGIYVTSFESLFYNCNKLTSVPTNIPQTVTNLSGLFTNCTIFNDANISSWQVSNVTNMSNMFNGAISAFNRNIGSWDVSRVTNMSGMFSSAEQFNNGGSTSINNWNTSRVLNMSATFYAAKAFNQPIGNWDVSNVTDMSQMFTFASVFNKDISNWNVGNVTNMNNMFASSVFNQYIGNWNVSNVTNMGNMFYSSAFNQNIGQWNTSNVTSMGGMFNLNGAFVQFIRCWNVSNVTAFGGMFESAGAMAVKYTGTTGFGNTPTSAFFNGIVGLTFDVSAGTQVSFPFNGSLGTFTIDWGNGTITTGAGLTYTYPSAGSYGAVLTATPIASTIYSFGSQSALSTGFINLTGIYSSQYSTWGMGSTPTFISLYGASKLVSVPLTLPINLSSTANMFYGASSFNQSLSRWNVQYITGITGMFEGASTFNQNLSSWYPNSATNMSRLFYGATAYNNGGVALTWNTSAVTNMTSMFEFATNFNAGITSFNVSGVTNMTQMFKNATTFNQNIRGWVVGSTTTLTDMFYNATAFQAVYYPTTPGYTNRDTPLYTFFNYIPVRYPCFMEGTQILCFKNNKEVYRPIQELRKGDLVKTISNGYLPIYMIGTSEFKNPGHNARVPNRLYKYTSEKYPELFEDLYITGCHSILVPFLTDDEWDNTKELLGDIFITDNHFRLMACLDENAEPYCKAAYINIYHIALENTSYYMNYGVYANGLLVESCSKRYLTELSNMRILGEADTRLKDNVLAMNTKYNSNIAVV